MLSSEVRRDVQAALEASGFRIRRMTALSGHAQHKRGRWALRVELTDGVTVKARRLESASAAKRSFELRAGLEKAFAPAICWHDTVLLEEWIDGAPLDAAAERERLEEAGALLGRLHSAPHPGVHCIGVRPWREEATETLRRIRDEAKLRTREIAVLESLLDESDPGMAPSALVHRDFCAENLLIDSAGRLRVIDNEWIEVGPIGFDLSRTRGRWPLADRSWSLFWRGYRSEGLGDPGAGSFWETVVALRTAAIRWHAPDSLSEPLDRLRVLASGKNPP